MLACRELNRRQLAETGRLAWNTTGFVGAGRHVPLFEIFDGNLVQLLSVAGWVFPSNARLAELLFGKPNGSRDTVHRKVP